MSRSPERSEGEEAISKKGRTIIRDCSRLPKNLFGEQVASLAMTPKIPILEVNYGMAEKSKI